MGLSVSTLEPGFLGCRTCRVRRRRHLLRCLEYVQRIYVRVSAPPRSRGPPDRRPPRPCQRQRPPLASSLQPLGASANAQRERRAILALPV
jgi:hypothetical protein